MAIQRNVTVDTPAASQDLITIEELKRELGMDLTSSESTDDTILHDMITGFSIAFAKYCRITFVKETVTEKIWPGENCEVLLKKRGDPIVLSRKPIVSITSLILDGSNIDINFGIRKNSSKAMIWKEDSSGDVTAWYLCTQATIVYEAGYVIQDVPADIKRALIITVKENWDNLEENSRLRSEQNYNVGTWQYFDRQDNIPPQALSMLQSGGYREAFARD